MPESHAARTDQGYSYHELEIRYVAVPAELGSGWILSNQGVREIVRLAADPCGGFRPERV
jgi:hypothetical protein